MQTDRNARIDSPSRRLRLSLHHRETTRWLSWFGDDLTIEPWRGNPGRLLWFAIRTLLTRSALCVLFVSASHAADIELTEVQNDIRELIRRGSPVHPSDATFHDYRDALERFYGPSGYALAWFVPAGPKPMLATALAELAAAPKRGLDAADYEVDRLASALQAIAVGDHSAQRVARTDVAVTQALLHYLTDLHTGRVSPSAAGFRLNGRADGFDVVALLRQALATGRPPKSLRPPNHRLPSMGG